MRIGKRQIQSVPGISTRPTTARVREAVLNIWQFQIPGCRWLDLCAGTGAMGAAALVRGAAEVVGIEQASRACRIIAQNWQAIAQSHQHCRVLRGDVLKVLPTLKGQVFHCIYFDPPYHSGLYEPVLAAIAANELLALGGICGVEHEVGVPCPSVVGPLKAVDQRKYGKTMLTFFQI